MEKYLGWIVSFVILIVLIEYVIHNHAPGYSFKHIWNWMLGRKDPPPPSAQ